MKLLRVITSMNPISGGPCQGIRNSIPYMLEAGVLNEVVCLDDPKDDYGISDNFKIYKLGNGRTGYQYQKKLFSWLFDNLYNYSHVIVHGIWQYPNYAMYKAIKKLNKEGKSVPKYGIKPHGMLDPYFQKATERRFKAIRNELVWRLTEKKAINNAHAVFFTCEEELKLARTTFKGYKPKKEINVGYGIQHPPRFHQKFTDSLRGKLPALTNKYFLFLSRIHPKKGVDLLVKAYKDLVEKDVSIPDLVIAGPKDSDYAKEMIRLAENHPQIHFPGMLSGNEKWGAFYNCEAFILPSHQENFGIAVVEAMACGKPVVISKNVNIWREIERMKAGCFFETLSEECIKKMLFEISQYSTDELKHIGEQAEKTFRAFFDSKYQSETLIEELKKL